MKAILFRKTFTRLVCAGLIFFALVDSAISQTEKVKMAFIGNSITAGVYDYGLSDLKVSYATQFKLLMDEVYGDTLLTYNAGVSGRTLTKNGPSPIWNESLFKGAMGYIPDICLIALGTNDSKPSLYNLVQNEFYSDYQDMIDTFRYVNPNVTFVVCLPPPIWDGHPYSTTDPHNDTLLLNYTIPLIDSVAKVNNLFVVDFHTPFVDSTQYFTDKLHPNVEGHKKMAKILFDSVIAKDIIRETLIVKDSIAQIPDAKFTSDVTTGDVDLTVSFTDNSTGNITEWAWDFGDGGTSDEQNPSHVYTEAGVYSISLTVTGEKGSDTEVKEDFITVNASSALFDNKNYSKLIVYPNPSQLACMVNIPDEIIGTVDIIIYNINGSSVFLKRNIEEKLIHLDISGLDQGMYHVTIKSDAGILTDWLQIN